MSKKYRTIFYLAFFFSGLAGLIYQIVWTRMLFIVFGLSIHSVVAVTSSFMSGLALGSYISGILSSKHKNILRFFAFLELVIAISALFLPLLFQLVSNINVYVYQNLRVSDSLWLIKFILVFISLLIPTTAMGATLPAMIEFFQRKNRFSLVKETGLLYAVNTFGAFTGVILAGFFLIEMFGLIKTAWIGVMINFFVGLVIWRLSKKEKVDISEWNLAEDRDKKIRPKLSHRIAISVFALSGLISMIYEIVWMRLLTPSTGSFVYAFSIILALILLGIALGSYLTKYFAEKNIGPVFLLATCELIIGVGAFLSILAVGGLIKIPLVLTVIFIIFFSALAMGMTFPIVMRLLPGEMSGSAFAGNIYMLNTLGAALGPLVGGYVLIPRIGSGGVLILLSCVNFIFAAVLAIVDGSVEKRKRGLLVVLSVTIITVVFTLYRTDNRIFTERYRKIAEEQTKAEGNTFRYLEDESASVLAVNGQMRMDSQLLVDGIGMTSLVEETKLMAHLPILLHPDPKDMLVICFGMGATFRSALSYGINVDAVELIPAVVKMFPVFFTNASEVLNNPKGKIYINDGRNYIRLTKKKYDIIQVDPPPPVNSTGSTVLYSQEFYEDSRKNLKDNGLFIQWVLFDKSNEDNDMLIKSFSNVFPHMAVFRSPGNMGIFLIGSLKPISINKTQMQKRLDENEKANKDLNEWGFWNAARLENLQIKNPSIPLNTLTVKDMFPRVEYYLLRHYFLNMIPK